MNSGYTAAPHDGTPKQASAKETGCRCRQGNDRRPSNQPDDKEQGAVHGLHPLIVKPPESLPDFRAAQGRELVHPHLLENTPPLGVSRTSEKSRAGNEVIRK